MDVQPFEVDRETAHKMWLKYQTHKNYQSPLDADIARVYKAISQGKLIVSAHAAMVQAGLGPDMLPRLALARADAKKTFLQAGTNGAATMIDDERWLAPRMAKTRYHEFTAGSFPGIQTVGSFSALVPHIPPDIRPKRGIQNYHILYEAVWRHEAPVDPMLLRHLGGDMWLVVGAWDLTDVERAVMIEHAGRRRQ